MRVFKDYFKIVKKHLGIIIMFASISIGMSVANMSFISEDENYVDSNPKLGVINYDSSSLTNDFIKYMENNSEKLVYVNDNKKEIQDALYNNKVDAILIIPENFKEELLLGNEPKLEIKKSTKNFSEYTELLVNRYFKIAKIYAKLGMSESEIISKTNIDLEKEIDVNITNKNAPKLKELAIYYSFENYAFLSIFIFVIGTIMCVFNKEAIKKRTFVSSMSPKAFSRQLFMGHICTTILIWFAFVLVSIIVYRDLMFNLNALLMVINSFIFALCATSLAYLIGNLIKNQNVISGVQNTISLGLSFISGCFVPADILDKNILNFSKIFPSYWYVSGNYQIADITEFNFESLKPIFQNYIIIFVFCIIYYLLSKVIIKIKYNKHNLIFKNK